MLERIASPEELKKLTPRELEELAGEIREKIIATVAESGGHLASNLGVVEATIALHLVFSSPKDKILFDVGHQSYAHKLLTGRYENFSTLRSLGGISGFQNREESEHDALTEGHCGTSISAALGIAAANKLQGKDGYAVAVVGDGALTNGMIYEGLNNCSEKELRLVILVNDNDMSISGSVGGMHSLLTRIRTGRRYFRFKHNFEKMLLRIPLLGKPLRLLFRKCKNFTKRIFVKKTLFEDIGVSYYGPVDGHNIERMRDVLEEAKYGEKCCIVHVITQKGKGYEPAEREPEKYHSFCAGAPQARTFTSYAGDLACDLAQRDESICALTAAMCDGVGLSDFASRFPSRFFDVGIAEEHSVTFACGLAANRMKPILFLYSTFAQRCYDQLLHDISIQNLPLVLMLDHAGIVSGDGITHQGIFDYALFSIIPNTVIYAPATYQELASAFSLALKGGGLSVVRYPKGGEEELSPLCEEETLSYTAGVEEKEVVVVTYGRITKVALEAARLFGEDRAGVVKLFRIYPPDVRRLIALVKGAKLVYFLEEGCKEGGAAEKCAAEFQRAGCDVQTHIHAIEGFVPHGSLNDLFGLCGFTAEEIVRRIKSLV